MDTLRIRVYNVHFGDAILVSIPDMDANDQVQTRHILIDFGNVSAGQGGDNSLFDKVVSDILDQTGGQPLDLFVMSHEHLDHVQGPLYSSQRLNKTLTAKYAWLSGSAARDYYDKHPQAKEQTRSLLDTYSQIRRFCLANFEVAPLLDAAAAPARAAADAATSAEERQAAQVAEQLATMLLNNNLLEQGPDLLALKPEFQPTDSRSTAHCVEFLRQIAPEANTTYVYRGIDLTGQHNFNETKFSIWAPEENTATYYPNFQPMALNLGRATAAGRVGDANSAATDLPVPPPGVDAGAFYDLLASRQRGYADNLLTIDKAKNNTSVVLCIEWRGWRLLFPGDAELESWDLMNTVTTPGTATVGVLEPVHFLKIGHHGSSNATPMGEILEHILPMQNRPDDRRRVAVVSTFIGSYNNVPNNTVLKELADRCDEIYSPVDLSDILDVPFINQVEQDFIDVSFQG